ncbi:MAG TPA: CPBP family intramembrane metalloprotease [Candidatus Izemoplasmatales bacterium]|nr:CPBP family intramembrane metalloprotease [Bacillota bacterium]HRY78342.1 CPBP family intramembrane metalloprotease [Candidatus Izemoplasmatales bacterium]
MRFGDMTLDFSSLGGNEIWALAAYVFLYLTYYFFSDFPLIKRFRMRFGETPEDFEASVYFRRTAGFVLLGVVPLLLTAAFFERPIVDYGVGLPSLAFFVSQYGLLTMIPVVLLIGGSLFRSEKSIDLSYYPEVRKKNWTKRRTILNACFWALYLLGYEFALRGMVFFSSLYAFGLWPAIFINSVIYSMIHIFKGPKEAFGAFFLGVLFCWITYYSGSFWIAFLIHWAIAVLNDVKAVHAAKAPSTNGGPEAS